MSADSLPIIDSLWNYADPAGTGRAFREILPRAVSSGDEAYHAELLTQIARTDSLQGKFAEAHATLDAVEPMLTDGAPRVRVRYLLERGRTFNSGGQPATALGLFAEARDIAFACGEKLLGLDAVHMVAIAQTDPQAQIATNLEGIAIAEADRDVRRWLFALYNNIGEAYASLKQYDRALESAQKLVALYKSYDREPDRYALKDVARFSRLTGRPADSVAMMEPLLASIIARGEDDGWIRAELAMSLADLGRAGDARSHAANAFAALSGNAWCVKNELEMLQRLKQLSE